MNLHITNETKNIEKELGIRDYNIVSFNKHIDVIICNLKESDLSQLHCCKSNKSEEVLIIDIGSKSIEDMENTLVNRKYSTILSRYLF